MKNSFVVKCIAVVLFAVFMTTLLLSGACIVYGIGSGAFGTDVAESRIKHIESTLYRYEIDISDYYEGYVKYSLSHGISYEEYGLPYIPETILYEIRDENNNVIYSNLEDTENSISVSFGRNFSVLKDEYENNEVIIERVEESTSSVQIYDNDTSATDEQPTNDSPSYSTDKVEYETTLPYETDEGNDYNTSKYYENKSYTVTIQYKEGTGIKDVVYYIRLLFDFVAENKTVIYALAVISAVSVLVLIVFILNVAGHHTDNEKITVTKFDKIPHDILTVIYIGITYLLFIAVFSLYEWCENFYYNEYNFDVFSLFIIMLIACVLLDFILLGILIMTVAVRFKASTYIKSTIIYKIIILVFMILKSIWHGIVRISKSVWKYIRKIPLVWKTVLVCVVLLVGTFFILSLDWGYWWPTVWIINCILCVGVIFVSILLKDIKNGTEDIANGNVYKKIDTKYLFLDLKDHAENINNMSDGIQKAVAEQMKSERLKTELITNVSHDIKTPLTSIINYVDLLEKEEIENETAKEYIDVLSRQSIRLKKLIDDLLEASKVSTGNISVNLMEFELGILLSQALAEYEERFEKNNLQVVLNKTDEALYVMADNRHMWRVFDNILNNIAKYAQSGTRVYIDAKRKDKNVEISFRNISKDPLNISGDELMERFVRGDSSRNTEGSGLGLSIAKSLTEVQKGNLNIQIDGDLFKVCLTFPLNKL